jgi:hypothetical protein
MEKAHTPGLKVFYSFLSFFALLGNKHISAKPFQAEQK